MSRYLLREDSGAEEIIEASDLADAADKARAWVEGGDYDAENCASTFTTRCYVFALSDGRPAPGTPPDEVVTVRFRCVDGLVESAS